MSGLDSPAGDLPGAPHVSAGLSEPDADPRVFEVVEEYLRELEQGHVPDRRQYVQRYPEVAETVARCLDGLELVQAGFARPRSVRVATAGDAAQQPASLPGEGAAGRLAQPLGDFQILRPLARGGMGVVYEAVQLSLGRRVALKVLPLAATLDPRQLQRFKVEAQAAALLHHSHIVPIYAFGCERGVHFYAMQLIEGESLAEIIAQLAAAAGHPPGQAPEERSWAATAAAGESSVPAATSGLLPAVRAGQAAAEAPGVANGSPECRSTVDVSAGLTAGDNKSIRRDAYVRSAARLMLQAAEALDHAHQLGVIHRDIKPANLLVDVLGNLWITDFGLAQLHSENGLTRSGDVVGTLRYMSPEQASGQRNLLDPRTDIYSLGVTFYELLALEPPFPGESYQELLFRILHDEPRPLRDRNPAVPRELETVILKCLSKQASERYSSAAEFAADIRRFLDHEPVRARRPSLIERLRKWARRHPSAVVAGALLLAITTAVSLVSHRRIAVEQQRTKEAYQRERARALEAEERFQQARQAVDTLFEISEEELADRPAGTARKRILEVVLSHYQDFVDQRRGDPASQAELAQVQDRVRRILRELELLHREMQLSLLADDRVQRELRLSDGQQQSLDRLLHVWSTEQQAVWDAVHHLAEDERRQRVVAVAEAHERAVNGLLTPEQLRRFKQLALQAQGLAAFREPQIITALNLAADQRLAIRDLERRMFFSRVPFGIGRGGGHGPPDGLGGPPGDDRKGPPPLAPHPGTRGGGMRPPPRIPAEDVDVWTDQAVGLLDAGQRATWASLIGPRIRGLAGIGAPPPPPPPLPDRPRG